MLRRLREPSDNGGRRGEGSVHDRPGTGGEASTGGAAGRGGGRQRRGQMHVSISCETIWDNMELCAESKRTLVPEGGVIFPAAEVEFYEGESVFDVLQRVCRENRIHMESSWTPVYNSVYVEGIQNLYEFDVGEGSGWMYAVNGWYPNYGCSRYQLKDGDVVAWRYTCDLGYDLGSTMGG